MLSVSRFIVNYNEWFARCTRDGPKMRMRNPIRCHVHAAAAGPLALAQDRKPAEPGPAAAAHAALSRAAAVVALPAAALVLVGRVAWAELVEAPVAALVLVARVAWAEPVEAPAERAAAVAPAAHPGRPVPRVTAAGTVFIPSG